MSLSHQKSRFIASKGIGLYLVSDAQEGILENIYLMLVLLHHKRYPFITTDVDGVIFLKIFKVINWEKNARKRYYYCTGNKMMKLELTLKNRFYGWKSLWFICIENNFAKYFAKCHNLFI